VNETVCSHHSVINRENTNMGFMSPLTIYHSKWDYSKCTRPKPNESLMNESFSDEYTQEELSILDWNSIHQTTEKDEDVNRENAKLLAIPNDEKYANFLDFVCSRVDGDLDEFAYKDRCIKLFGVKAYPLYAMDNLILQLAKQVNKITCSESSMELLNLYTTSREVSTESDYQENCRKILPDDERIFRFDFNKSTFDLKILLFPNNADLNATRTQWISYIKKYVMDDVSYKKHVFLQRNIKTIQKKYPTITDAEKDVIVSYDLECIIPQELYKPIYVTNTEDFFFYRTNCLKRGNLIAQKYKNFDLEKILNTLPPQNITNQESAVVTQDSESQTNLVM